MRATSSGSRTPPVPKETHVLQYVDCFKRRRLERTFRRIFLFLFRLLLMPLVDLLARARDQDQINVLRPQIGGFGFGE